MVSYEDMKKALNDDSNDSKYFTRAFYVKYLEERKQSFDWFCDNGEWKSLTESEASDFYIKNGSGWCRMLEILYASFQKFRVDFFTGSYPHYDLIERKYVNYESEEEARKWAGAYKPNHLIDVLKVQ